MVQKGYYTLRVLVIPHEVEVIPKSVIFVPLRVCMLQVSTANDRLYWWYAHLLYIHCARWLSFHCYRVVHKFLRSGTDKPTATVFSVRDHEDFWITAKHSNLKLDIFHFYLAFRVSE